MEKNKLIIYAIFIGLHAYGQKDSITRINTRLKIDYNFNHGAFTGSDLQEFTQHILRVEYKGYYASATTTPINTISLGRYQRIFWKEEAVGVLHIQAGLRFEGSGGNISMRYTHWWKRKIIPFLGIVNFFSGRPNDVNGSDVYVVNTGAMYTIHDRKVLTLTLFQDISDFQKTVTSLRYKYTWDKHIFDITGILGSEDNIGVSGRYTFKKIYIQSSYFKNIDFSKRSQYTIGLGYRTTL
jgi:hypothetical protein